MTSSVCTRSRRVQTWRRATFHVVRTEKWRLCNGKLWRSQSNYSRILPTICRGCHWMKRGPAIFPHCPIMMMTGRIHLQETAPHHRTLGSWAEIPSEESAVSTPPEAAFSSPSSPELEIPLSSLPSARPHSPDLPQWIFGDEPGLIEYMHAVLQPIPGKPLPPIPTTQRERALQKAELAEYMDKIKAQQRTVRLKHVHLPPEERIRYQENTKELAALYIRKWDHLQEGEEPLERRRATVAKFDKVRGYGTLLDCHTGQTILVNRRAVQRPYLHKKFYSLEMGEIVEYIPVQGLRGEWDDVVTRPTAPTQLPFKYFLSTDWESDPFNLRPKWSAPDASTPILKEEEPPQQQSSSVYSKVLRPAQDQESRPKLRAPKTVPRPSQSNESWPPARVPAKVLWPAPSMEMELKPYAPTLIPTSKPLVTLNPTVTHSTLTNVVWESYINTQPAPDIGRARGSIRGTRRVWKNVF
ncbi:uncharacterized protein LOC130295196 [Hyla sarda]|uniref:uncharacterized protein LOC130295196 n=1 Tax=Hyla sarda TaxID=327740 RepID=UPI0024C285C4|nr:uncharacterized protein LOC130295196 [Hyla sarda]